MKVTNPKGEDVGHYARTVATDPDSSKPPFITVPIAYNDPSGVWTLTVREVATGVQEVFRGIVK
ncbi:MAG: hypothetical protein NZ959_07755 [Armatimonadetes bacterium]|nr:hypothetical protein [Armatimonadota bacterium]MDW8121679.1 hypothetical protein [Armatimonadota bacterium]